MTHVSTVAASRMLKPTIPNHVTNVVIKIEYIVYFMYVNINRQYTSDEVAVTFRVKSDCTGSIGNQEAGQIKCFKLDKGR